MSHDEFTYIIGHKNPDADAICSAIAYANLKILQGHKGCIPARCGNTNARIDTILAKFSQPTPLFVGDVSPRARDITVHDVVKVSEKATISEALELIDERRTRPPLSMRKDALRDMYPFFRWATILSRNFMSLGHATRPHQH